MRGRLGYYLAALILYLGLFYSFPISRFSVPILLGVFLGAALPRARALQTTALTWISGCLIAPPQRVWFPTYYYETDYLDEINQAYPFHSGEFLMGLMLALGAACAVSLVRWNEKKRRLLATSLLGLICLGQLIFVAIMGRHLPATFHLEPADKSYSIDGLQLLKLLHLYRNGNSYYEAYRLSMEGDTRIHNPGYLGSSLRPPLQFWILKQLPDLRDVPLVYWGFTVITQILVFFASKRLLEPLPSLVGPAVLGAYFIYPNSTLFLLIPDLAAGQLIVIALAIYVLSGWRPAQFVLGIALLVREWAAGFLLWAGIFALYRWRKQRHLAPGEYEPGPGWEALAALLVLIVDGLIYLHHYQDCASIAGMTGTLPVQYRMNGSPLFAISALLHGSIFIAGRELLVPLLAISALAALRRFPHEVGLWLGVVPALGLFVALFKFGDIGGNQYYGFTFTPLLLWAGCLFIGSLSSPEAEEPAHPPEKS